MVPTRSSPAARLALIVLAKIVSKKLTSNVIVQKKRMCRCWTCNGWQPTCAQRLLFMWTRKHGLTGKPLKIFEILVRFCITFYFLMFYNIKVKHLIVDAPYHKLTTLRLLRAQPKVVRDCITFYVRTGACCFPSSPVQILRTGDSL